MNKVVAVNVSGVSVEADKEIVPYCGGWTVGGLAESRGGLSVRENALLQVGEHVILVGERKRCALETLVTGVCLEVAGKVDDGGRGASKEELLN